VTELEQHRICLWVYKILQLLEREITVIAFTPENNNIKDISSVSKTQRCSYFEKMN
jgi:hypothetical protein